MNESGVVMTEVWKRIIIVNVMIISEPRIREGFSGTPNSFD